MAEFTRERKIKATRKRHVCEQCGSLIEIGSKAMYHTGHHDGDFYTGYQHMECYGAGIAYAKMTNRWDDEFTWFYVMLDDRDDELWLLRNHPIVAERLGLSMAEAPTEPPHD